MRDAYGINSLRSSSHVSNTPRSTTSTIPGAEQAREEVLA
ncbi:hypothetical protein L916_15490 [Phytophthora nicotianae]|uniref:Uncharacterized protein n=1 Tax=Phytophthora nicotianae TaxID=4792 RepID=W2IEJ2_PHYNI|nr:hypothetical protein L916_15490 [Phytophthora nicotianae]